MKENKINQTNVVNNFNTVNIINRNKQQENEEHILYYNKECEFILDEASFDVVHKYFTSADKSKYKFTVKSKSGNEICNELTGAVNLFFREFSLDSFIHGLYNVRIESTILPIVLNDKIYLDRISDDILRAKMHFCLSMILLICKARKAIDYESKMKLRCTLLTNREIWFNIYVNKDELKDYCNKKYALDYETLISGASSYRAVDFVGELFYKEIVPQYYYWVANSGDLPSRFPDISNLTNFTLDYIK